MLHNTFTNITTKSLALLAAGMVLCTVQGAAQPIDTIKPNPNAVQLRRIWSVTGGEFGGGRVGSACSNLGDVFHIGRSAFVVYASDTGISRIYLWDTATQGVQQVGVIPNHAPLASQHAIVGNFLGDGRQLIVLRTGYRDSDAVRFHAILDFYQVTGDTILDVPVLRLADSAMSPPTAINPSDCAAADLDGDGDDELILYMDGLYRNNVYTKYSEVWIFRGGPGLRLDTPTVVLRALEQTDQNVRRMWVNDCDGDGHLDITTFGRYYGRLYRLYFYFGRDGSPWNWSIPDRVVDFGSVATGVADIDGDHRIDLLQPSPVGRIALVLSNTGKSYRDRPLTLDDIDLFYYGAGRVNPVRVGYLSDSLHRYEMLGLQAGSPKVLLNGAPSGPDPLYDAFGDFDPYTFPGPDITGDGWDDLLTSYYPNNFNAGIASIWAGGPYIPRDPAMGVRWYSDGTRENALALWPNPARDLVHIAWRGDLHRPPASVAVCDLSGRCVARGSIPLATGEMLWACADVPSGVYWCTVADDHGLPLTTMMICILH